MESGTLNRRNRAGRYNPARGDSMNHTRHRFDWQNGYTKERRLSRSFATLEEAQRFAEGKRTADIYKAHGRFKVEWIKTEGNND